MARRTKCYSEDVPAWARYNGETYVSSFSGTEKQRKEHEKMLDALFSGRIKNHKKNKTYKRGKRKK